MTTDFNSPEAPAPDVPPMLEDATDRDHAAALEELLTKTEGERAMWKDLGAAGATDKEIRQALTRCLGSLGRNSMVPGVCQIKSKPKFGFWYGSFGVGKPTLEGDALIGKVRAVFRIPESGAPGEEIATAQADNGLQMSLFDYAQLDDETAATVKEHTAEINRNLSTIRQSTKEVARRLLETKRLLERGQWSAWVASETPLTLDTADRLVAVGELMESAPQFAEIDDRFDKSALYLLAAPSTPDSARAEATARAEAGEHITHATAAEIKTAHKQTENVDTAGGAQELAAGENAPEMTSSPAASAVSENIIPEPSEEARPDAANNISEEEHKTPEPAHKKAPAAHTHKAQAAAAPAAKPQEGDADWLKTAYTLTIHAGAGEGRSKVRTVMITLVQQDGPRVTKFTTSADFDVEQSLQGIAAEALGEFKKAVLKRAAREAAKPETKPAGNVKVNKRAVPSKKKSRR